MKIPDSYNYKPFQSPRIGLFLITKEDGVYSFPTGWETEQEEVVIIGEDKDCFVYELRPSQYGYWEGKKRFQKRMIVPHGIHKSRLIKWIGGQLELF